MMRKMTIRFGFIFMIALSMACQKFLEEKPNSRLAIPTTVKDFQALLDHYQTMNHADANAGEISSDDYFVFDADWAAQSENERRMYLWYDSFVFGQPPNSWSNIYRTVYRTNVVLDGLQTHRSNDEPATWNDLEGQALFHRARSFLQAASIWAVAYDERAAEVPGIPLRLNPDFSEQSVRATLQETYEQIIHDFQKAAKLLPESTAYVYRPSKAAAFGMLARTYLYMRDYPNALRYADSCLLIKNDIMDFNALVSEGREVPEFNKEIIFYSHMYGSSRFLRSPLSKVSIDLYGLYSDDDLRRQLFFEPIIADEKEYYAFIGSYNTTNRLLLFSGLTTTEVLLTRAECNVRLGDLSAALADLNRLRRGRIKEESFDELQSTDDSIVLNAILSERRRELLFRGLRWMDIKRLNHEGMYISLQRTVNGNTFQLLPNSDRFALPIPEEVITISGMPQNEYK